MNTEQAEKLKEKTVERIDVSRDVSDAEVYEIIDQVIRESVRSVYADITDRLKMRRDIFNSIRGLDILQDLIEDDTITEIMVNGAKKIFVERKGRLYLSERRFASDKRLEDIIQKIASGVNRTVNEAHPIVDARLSDGSRVNIVLPPASLDGAVVTIRKFAKDVMSMEHLIGLNSISKEAAAFLSTLVKGHYNILCSGGTGCGKTTMLNALAGSIGREERIITIEDSAELIIENLPNLVRLEARNANSEGKNEITIRHLIKTALRMRPDRIIVGEVRGKEAIDMLQGLNTGHCGMSTAHANSAKDLLFRLETMVLLDENIPLQAIRAQISSAIDIIVGISRMRDNSRRVTEICEVDGMENGEIRLNRIYEFREFSSDGKEALLGGLVQIGELKHDKKLKMYGLKV